jgi:hypothetical protein
MGLVDYSDSDTSDVEEVKVTKPAITTSGKPAFRKVVDRSNPGKIKVSLPQASLKNENLSDEPPTKRVKTSGGGAFSAFSGFNSFLPAPKKTGQAASATTRDSKSVTRSGLGAGVSLKTGAAPGFSRHSEADDDYGGYQEGSESGFGGGMGLPAPKASQPVDQKPAEEVKLVGKPLMFRPLSVAQKPKKKKTAASMIASSIPPPAPSPPQTPAEKAPRVKVSLFSMSQEASTTSVTPSQGEYEPILLESQTPSNFFSQTSMEDPYSVEEYTPNPSQTFLPFAPTPPTSQSLDDIAGDLHLSAAERRQLFGRQKSGQRSQFAATKVINFNTDQEYLHNEELRAAGEQVKHNPVRAIAPGKHSLKQLVNAAQTQKDALEESFQAGKNNRKEASSRYGW